MIRKDTLSKIKNFALKMDWEESFKGKAQGNRHLFRVNKIAKFLAEKEGADLDIVEAAAWLHDVGLICGSDNNPRELKKIALKILREFDLTKSEAERIKECIVSHEGALRPKSLEAKIVYDADTLDKMGLLGIIRHTWKLANLREISGSDIGEKTVQEILNHIKWRQAKLNTATAKRLSRHITVKIGRIQAKKIVRAAANLAKKGIISEKIAESLLNQMRPRLWKELRSQLSLIYLEKNKND